MAATTRDDLQHLLLALEEFEPKYRAYIEIMKRPGGDEIHVIQHGGSLKVNDREWSEEKIEATKIELLELAPSVDEALVEAGVGVPALGYPPAIGGGLMAQGVTSLLFNHGPVGLDESGFAVPTIILQKVVAAKGALKAKLKRSPTSPVAIATRQRRGKQPAPPQGPRHWRGLVGRVRFIPTWIGFIADIGGAVVVVAFLGRITGVW